MIKFKTTILISVLLTVASCSPVVKQSSPKVSVKSYAPELGQSDNVYYHYLSAQMARIAGQLDIAAKEMERAITIDSDSVYLKKELAALYSRNKQYDKALEVIEKVLNQEAQGAGDSPKDTDALIMAGQIHLARENADRAIVLFEEAISHDISREDVFHMLGNIYMQKKDFENAKRVYLILVDHHPTSYVGYFFLGRVYTEIGHLKEAEESFNKTLALAPNLEEPRFRLIDLYQSQGKTDKAQSLYQQLLTANQRNVRAILGLALLEHKSGNIESAQSKLKRLGTRSAKDKNVIPVLIRHYIDSKKFNDTLVLTEGMLLGEPSSGTLNYLTGLAYDEVNQEEKALGYFRRVGPESDFYKNAALQVGYILNDQGNTREAIDHVQNIIEKIPNDFEPYLYLGIFQEDLEDYTAALASIRKGLAIKSDNTALLFRLGVILDKAGNKNECIETMKKLIDLDPDHANALNYLGYTYADLGKNLKEAERLIKKALQIKPEDGYITDSLGWVYFKDKKYAQALEVLLRAVALVPDDPIILEHTGDAYLKTNNRQKAIEFYRRSLKFQKGDTQGIEKKIRDLTGK